MGNDAEKALIRDVASFYADPYRFVLYAFPWGRVSLTGVYERPDDWQIDILKEIGRQIVRPIDLDSWQSDAEAVAEAIRIAVASGHGIGKTALIAWIIIWFMSTRPNPQIVVTANTAIQLETKTWRELAKWHKLAINKHWFEWTASKFYLKKAPDTWFAKAVPWSVERAEAFAGTHERDVLLVFDEGSAVADEIWETAEGALTTEGAVWVVFGNPTRNTGRFCGCFNDQRHRWTTRQIDSRTSRIAVNRKQIDEWIEDYGEDSDFVRVRVRGVFPRAGSAQFIASDLVDAAAGKHLVEDVYRHAPRLLGVDVARFGEDQSVIIRRQGLAATNLQRFRGKDTMWLAGAVVREIEAFKPDAVFVDECGLGAGVVDRLRQLGHDVIGVNSGREAVEPEYFNLRAEMWGKLREWLRQGAAMPDDRELKADLIGPEYGFDARNRIQLEKKEDMKKRGLASPDAADALALTFAQPVATRSVEDMLAAALSAQNSQSSYPLPEHLR